MKNIRNLTIVIFIFLLMIMNAVVENMRGVLVPIFKTEFFVKDTSIGFMFLIGSLGYMIATFLGGLLSEKVGQKKVLLLGIIVMIGSLLLLSKTNTFPILIICMFFINVGLGMTSIAINTLIPVLLFSFQAVLMNLTHFCYGFGASIGPKLTGNLVDKGMDWRNIYLSASFGFILLFIIFIFIKMPNLNKKKELHKKINFNTDKKLIFFYIMALGFYISAEVGTGSWFVNYIKNAYNYNEAKSATYLSFFFGALTIGRFLGGLVVEKFGYINTVLKSLIIAFVLYTLGLLMGEKGLFLISSSGLFFAITFPTIVLTVSKVFKERISFITGIIVTSGCAINMVMNFVMGKLNDEIGYGLAFYQIPICLLISIIFTMIIYMKTKHKLVSRSE
ncbi:MFS transporter [Haloimpatiens sp. FM7330]|uniref:MFS transporter n=1 Tax=Haloimpatiens sp. FM7330 TaxID=3298610 RepID=UPI0036333AB5